MEIPLVWPRWTVDEVCEWLAEECRLDNEDVASFRAQRVTGQDLVIGLDEDVLDGLGITRALSRKRVLQGVAKLVGHHSGDGLGRLPPDRGGTCTSASDGGGHGQGEGSCGAAGDDDCPGRAATASPRRRQATSTPP